MSQSTGNRPVEIYRCKGVKVSIFENQAGEATFHKVTAQKIYRDEKGEWKTTHSYGRDDLPVLKLLIDRAWEFILDREKAFNKPPGSGEAGEEN